MPFLARNKENVGQSIHQTVNNKASSKAKLGPSWDLRACSASGLPGQPTDIGKLIHNGPELSE
eukprot:3471851-Pleurochrysis_carterae.AAC.7